MSTKSMNFKIDENLKIQFVKLAADLGLTSTNLLTMFVKRAVDEQRIPFEVKVVSKINPVYEQLFVEDQAKIHNIIQDDAETITESDIKEFKGLYV